MNANVQLLIIWHNAMPYKDEILAQLKSSSTLIKTIEMTWSQNHLQSNFSRFFNKKISLRQIEKDFGVGAFLVCFVSQTDNRVQNWYKDVINKTKGISLYLSEKPNRDATLLFGKCIDDVLTDEILMNQEYKKLNRDLVGALPFENLDHLFYVLNNTINYVVLRNYENLPNHFDPSIHGDIDLLVEDLSKVISITNATKMFPEKTTSVAYLVNLSDSVIQFDFRYLGDNYLDKQWECDILRSANFTPPYAPSHNIMIMSPVHQYFTLLYHAYVQKIKIASDYPDKLRNFALPIGATYKEDVRFSMRQLQDFLKENKYKVSIPSEKEGTLNWKNLKYLDTFDYYQLRIKYLLTRGVQQFIEKAIRKIKKLIHKLA